MHSGTTPTFSTEQIQTVLEKSHVAEKTIAGAREEKRYTVHCNRNVSGIKRVTYTTPKPPNGKRSLRSAQLFTQTIHTSWYMHTDGMWQASLLWQSESNEQL